MWGECLLIICGSVNWLSHSETQAGCIQLNVVYIYIFSDLKSLFLDIYHEKYLHNFKRGQV